MYRKSQTLLCHPAKAARKFWYRKETKRTRLDFHKREVGDSWLRFVNVNPKMDEL